MIPRKLHYLSRAFGWWMLVIGPMGVTGAGHNLLVTEGIDAEEIIVYTGLRPANWELYLFESPGRAPRALTNDPDLDYNPVFSPDGRWIVFCSERRGNPDLYVLDPQHSGKPRPLTHSDALEDAAAFSPDGLQLAFVSTREGNADIYVMPFRPQGPDASAEAVNLTRQGGGDFNPTFSPDGRKIAFSSNRDAYRASEIYVMEADGSSPRRLTQAKGWDGSPTWSLDGKAIYFYSEREGRARIYRMNADGSNPQPVTESGVRALSPAISVGGRIAFASQRNGRSHIFSVRLEGGDERMESNLRREYWAPAFDSRSGRMVCYGTGVVEGTNLVQSRIRGSWLINNRGRVTLPDRAVRMWAVRGSFPSVNPEGTLVVSSEDSSKIVIRSWDGHKAKVIFEPPRGSPWRPSWSRKGLWIACTVGRTFGGPSAPADIWKFRPDGGGAVNLTADSPANDGFPDFSPDGQAIVFRSGREGNHEIYLMDADGSNVRRLTHDGVTATMPAFSPRGDRIAFTSTRDGDYEIYSLQLSEQGKRNLLHRVTDSPGRDVHPAFSPDGEWLVFASERGGLNDEEPLIPVFNPQPYGDLYAVRLQDGLVVRLTHNKWEDGTPTWAPVSK